MLTRELKLKLNKNQESNLDSWLLSLQSIYNFGIRKIELNAKDKIYFSSFNFHNLLANHSKKLGIPSHIIKEVLLQAWSAWQRYFKKISRQPHLKSFRKPLRSIPFPDVIRPPKGNRIGVPGLGKVKFYKQELPVGKIKCGRIIKRASGWYLQLTIDTKYCFPVKENAPAIGIDTGIKNLLTLSNSIKFENPREFTKGSERLAQAQRGKRKKLTARLHERQANRRKDRNHKISRYLVENYSEIYITNDKLQNQAQTKRFGKLVNESSIGQLKQFLLYKGPNGGRKVVLIDSCNTTLTCSTCLAHSGPSGLKGLKVRHWECMKCGTSHDRDINAARNILNAGLGCSLGVQESL